MILKNAKTIVIKIGSTTLVDEDRVLRKKWIRSLCEDIAELVAEKKKVIIVSSGAVALGRKIISEKKTKLKIEEKQAAAAIGQPILMNEYISALGANELHAAQILLTLTDIENRRSYLNAKNTFETLLDENIIPIVNENDSVATEELKFGDNDRLSALVAQMVEADKLIIFSDIDGLYNDDPNKNKDAKHIAVVEKIDDSISSSAKGVSSNMGSGGMQTKISAAKIAAESGCATIITKGSVLNPLKKLNEGAKHTIFKTSETPKSAWKKWITNSLVAKGRIIIDDGAVKALQGKKSLLPIGIIGVEGQFVRGEKVSIATKGGKDIAKGISAYSSEDISHIKGKKSAEIEKILGYSGHEAVIHANDMVVL